MVNKGRRRPSANGPALRYISVCTIQSSRLPVRKAQPKLLAPFTQAVTALRAYTIRRGSGKHAAFRAILAVQAVLEIDGRGLGTGGGQQ